MEEKTLRSAHGRTNSRERWSCPRFPDAPPLTARLDSLTASSRSYPSQSLHMTERIFTHGGWIIACAASQLWIAGIAPSFVRRTLVFHRHSRFRSSKLRVSLPSLWNGRESGDRPRGRGRKYGQRSRPRDRPSHVGVLLSAAPHILSFRLEAGLGSVTDG
jgi:hypothetical protein